MKTSSQGIEVMHYFEQCKLKAYPDPGSKDGHPWTIGWGDTGSDVVPGLVITREEADRRFSNRLSREFEPGVTEQFASTISQHRFDALVCFAYNVGLPAFKSSTLLRLLKAGDVVGAGKQFVRWNKNDGKPMLGLARRRAAEEKLFWGASAEEAIEYAKSIQGVRP